MKLRARFFFPTTAALICLFACASPNGQINIAHLAEFNMSQYKSIAFGKFGGSSGSALESEIKKLLADGPFEEFEGGRLERALAERKITAHDLSDHDKVARLEYLTAGLALIKGVYAGDYSEENGIANETCEKTVGGKKTSLPCMKKTRAGSVVTNGVLEVLDVTTGKVIVKKSLARRCTASTEAYDSDPPPINKTALAGECLKLDAKGFVHAILPWKEPVVDKFLTDPGIPMLEAAIGKLKEGKTAEGVKLFESAAKSAATDAKLKPKNIAVAFWDLGLAYEHTGEFEKSLAALKRAFELYEDNDYINEMNRVKRLKREGEKIPELNMNNPAR